MFDLCSNCLQISAGDIIHHWQAMSKYFLFYLLNSIDKRRKEVMDRRQKVKDQAAERHNALLGSQAFQEFKRDAAEVR